MRPPLWIAVALALFAACCGRAPARSSLPDAVDAARAAPPSAPIGRLGACCECDVRDEAGDLPDPCIVPCEACLIASRAGKWDAAYYPWSVDLAAVADAGACECVGARF